MPIASTIILALALGISAMLLLHRCSEQSAIQLLPGIGVVAATAVIHTLLFWLGQFVGSMLSFQSEEDPTRYTDVNSYIFLGLTAIVVLKMLAPYLRREPRLPVFDLTQHLAVLAMAVSTGTNVLLIGVGVGFVGSSSPIALLVATLVLGTLGLMFGRQKVELRPRRWMIIASVLLLGVAIAAVINA